MPHFQLTVGCHPAIRMTLTSRSLVSTHPNLCDEWHRSKNGELAPSDVSQGSTKKVWWRCEQRHDWCAAVYSRAAGSGCPYCSGRIPTPDKSLEALRTDVAAEWDHEKNGDLLPSSVSCGSGRTVWWRCGDGHTWKARVSHRAKGVGCPYCSGRLATAIENLATVHPNLAAEWHTSRNVGRGANEFRPNSGKKAWWICKRGHEWESVIQSRAKGAGCPYCAAQVSRLELRVFTELQRIFENVEHKVRICGLECDVLIHGVQYAVEIDGFYWHQESYERDKAKETTLAKHGVQLWRLREKGLDTWGQNHVQFDNSMPSKAIVDKLLRRMSPFVTNRDKSRISAYLKTEQLLGDLEFGRLFAALPGPPMERSLATKRPELASQWAIDKNLPLSPEDFSEFSHRKVWWRCKKGHIWRASIASRSNGNGCPYCAGQRATKKTSLATTHPLIAREWHPDRNKPLTPEDVTKGSGKRLWWQCCHGHEWQAQIYNRTNGTACPECRRIERRGGA